MPDLVLLDLMMPDMDGHLICRKLREDRRLRDVPVIVFTAKSEVQDKKDLFDAGANDYLVKPTRPSGCSAGWRRCWRATRPAWPKLIGHSSRLPARARNSCRPSP